MNTEKEEIIIKNLSQDIKRIMTMDRNKENYAKFQNTIKDLKPKKCIVKFGWASGKAIGFTLIYEKDGNGNPYNEFIEGIEDKAEAFYFIMGLAPTIFHFNPRYTVSDHQYSMLFFKLKKYE